MIICALTDHGDGKATAAALGFEYDAWRSWLRHNKVSITDLKRGVIQE